MTTVENSFEFEQLNKNAVEAFQGIIRNIQYCSVESKVKTITITSCMPGEGKSTTAKKLAVCMAGLNIKVLLINADLHKPVTAAKQEQDIPTGLFELITGDSLPEEVIHETNIENLHFMDCGQIPPNPMGLVGSGKFRECLAPLTESYDFILIDAPPVGSVIDSAVVAAQTDGAILVIDYNTVNYLDAAKVKERFEKLNIRIIGVVLNRMKKREYKRYYKNYRFYN